MHNITVNYFDFFDLPIEFKVNYLKLKKNYLNIQNLYHPDKLINKSAQEKILFSQISIYANEAYKTLNNQAKLAAYWCKLHNINTATIHDAKILAKIMDWHEEIEEQVITKNQILQEVKQLFEEYIEKFSQLSKINPIDNNLAQYAQILLLLEKFILNYTY